MLAKLIEILKSKGKLGGWGLIALGLGWTAAIAWGKVAGDIAVSMGCFFMGLGVLGVRNKLDGLSK